MQAEFPAFLVPEICFLLESRLLGRTYAGELMRVIVARTQSLLISEVQPLCFRDKDSLGLVKRIDVTFVTRGCLFCSSPETDLTEPSMLLL